MHAAEGRTRHYWRRGMPRLTSRHPAVMQGRSVRGDSRRLDLGECRFLSAFFRSVLPASRRWSCAGGSSPWNTKPMPTKGRPTIGLFTGSPANTPVCVNRQPTGRSANSRGAVSPRAPAAEHRLPLRHGCATVRAWSSEAKMASSCRPSEGSAAVSPGVGRDLLGASAPGHDRRSPARVCSPAGEYLPRAAIVPAPPQIQGELVKTMEVIREGEPRCPSRHVEMRGPVFSAKRVKSMLPPENGELFRGTAAERRRLPWRPRLRPPRARAWAGHASPRQSRRANTTIDVYECLQQRPTWWESPTRRAVDEWCRQFSK